MYQINCIYYSLLLHNLFYVLNSRGVVSKNTLEMLPGNGTIVLDTIWHINLAVKSSVSAENSSSILSATNHMYQSAARLIKLCDDALIEGDKKEAALNVDNVKEVVQLVEDAVQVNILNACIRIMCSMLDVVF